MILREEPQQPACSGPAFALCAIFSLGSVRNPRHFSPARSHSTSGIEHGSATACCLQKPALSTSRSCIVQATTTQLQIRNRYFQSRGPRQRPFQCTWPASFIVFGSTDSESAEPSRSQSESSEEDLASQEASNVPLSEGLGASAASVPSEEGIIIPGPEQIGSDEPLMYGLQELPLFPLPLVLFPGAILPLHIFEERYKLMFKNILEGNKLFGVVLYTEESGRGKVASIGCCGEVLQHEKLPNGRMVTVNKGKKRFRVVQITQERPYIKAVVQWIDDVPPEDISFEVVEPQRAEVEDLLRGVLELSGKLTGRNAERSLQVLQSWRKRAETERNFALFQEFSFAVAGALEMETKDLQALLEMQDTLNRLKRQALILKSTRDYLAAESALRSVFPEPENDTTA